MASNTVNRPTNVAQKEADINQKLQLYGIYNGTLILVALQFWSVSVTRCSGRLRLLSRSLPQRLLTSSFDSFLQRQSSISKLMANVLVCNEADNDRRTDKLT